MRIVVTGGAGFIGSTIVRHLVAAKHSVRIVDNLSTGKRENVPDGCDWHVMDAAEADYSTADAIVHAAAYPDVSQNWKPGEVARLWQSNAELTRRVLDRAPSGCVFVLLSSAGVYGPGEHDESSIPRATSPYAASKLAAEALVLAYTEAGRVHGRILRPVAVVGPRYAHGHVADFVRQVRETGRIHALDNGRSRKSVVHVDDVARSVVNTWATNAARGPIVNVSSPTLWSWRDTAATMQAMAGRELSVTCEDRAHGWIGDPERLVVGSALGPDFYQGSIVSGVADALRGLGWPA